MEQFLHQVLEHGLLHKAMHRPNRLLAVFFFLVGVLVLAVSTVSWQRIQGYDAGAALYDQAPLCEQVGQVGCRSIRPVAVVQITERSVGRSTRHDFTVRQSDNTILTIEEAIGDLFPNAPAGTTIEAEYWQGKITRLRDGAGHRMSNWDDPDWLKSNNTLGIFIFPLLSALSFGAAVLMWRRARRPPRYR
jgi:hypothetical protein